MARLGALVMPPDAGTTNAGTVPAVGQCGRGNPRTYDITHIGDITGPGIPTLTMTPGTNSYSTGPNTGDSNAGPPTAGHPFTFDSQVSVFTTQAGGDASGEGFDGFSSKRGRSN